MEQLADAAFVPNLCPFEIPRYPAPKIEVLISLAAVVEGQHDEGGQADGDEQREEHESVDKHQIDAARRLAGMVFCVVAARRAGITHT